MSITENLKKILSSRYGKDVRQAIHDSIHDCYEDGKSGSTDLIARESIEEVKISFAEQIANEKGQIADLQDNLLPYPYFETTHTEDGIEWVDNGDGTVTANGTSTTSSVFNLTSNFNSTLVLPKGKYIVSGCPSGYNKQCRIRVGIGADSVFIGQDWESGLEFELQEETIVSLLLEVLRAGTTVTNAVFKPMLIRGGVVPKNYKPYSISNVGLQAQLDGLEERFEDQKNSSITNINVAILGDSNAALYQNSGLLDNSLINGTVQKLAVGGATYRNGSNSILSQYEKIEGTPDYIILWCGGNDISTFASGNIGLPQYDSFALSDFDESKTFGAVNSLICKLRTNYPSTKLIGVIRTESMQKNAAHQRFVYHVINELYHKWNVPTINLEYIANITEEVTESSNHYFTDDKLHYNTNALSSINDLIIGCIMGGLNTYCEIPCETYFYDKPNCSLMNVENMADIANEFLYYNMSASKLCYFINPWDNSYVKCIISKDDGSINIIKLAALSNKVDYYRIIGGNTYHEQFVKVSELKNGDVKALASGDYIVTSNNINNISNLPSGITTSDSSLLISARPFEVAGNASCAIYTLTTFSHRLFVGSLYEGKVNWTEKTV